MSSPRGKSLSPRSRARSLGRGSRLPIPRAAAHGGPADDVFEDDMPLFPGVDDPNGPNIPIVVSPRSRPRSLGRSSRLPLSVALAHGGPAVPVIPPPLPLPAVLLRRQMRPPRSPIPLPFVMLDGTDMGDRPIDHGVLGIFQHRGFRAGELRDVSSEIDDYVYGNDFRTVVAPMTEAQKSQFRVTCWVRFQNTLLVPAVNRMFPARETHMLQLTQPQRAYVRAQHSKLSPLQFFACNLYTKDSPGTSFFYALNRILLQVDAASQDIRLNALPYDDDKRVFNVWFYLFLSGIHKLIIPVPANFRNYPRSHPTVRLYRGLGVGENMSTVLWQPPEISESLDASHQLHTHMSLGFSSFTASVDVACRFSVPRVATMHPHIIVFEPRRGRIALPSLRLVSDTAVEDEFLMFPNYSVMVFSREEGVLESRALRETCEWSRVLAGDAAVAAAQGIDFTPVLESMPTRITWIGITDLTGATTLQEDIQGSRNESGGGGGGGRRRSRRRIVAKCKKTRKGRRLCRKTRRRHR
jgi:hypothetical protein